MIIEYHFDADEDGSERTQRPIGALLAKITTEKGIKSKCFTVAVSYKYSPTRTSYILYLARILQQQVDKIEDGRRCYTMFICVRTNYV